MTVMTGHTYRRYRFKKRTYRNQDLGPFVHHEMNRCIECYRCVRFYRDHAGGRDFDVFASHNHVYFGRARDGTLENEFSGNLVEVCPTGVFTDKPFLHHYTRKWDLQTAPSVCPHCSLGCNTTPGERYGMLRRIVNRFNSRVNGYFLCDRGRYGYGFVNHERRIRYALERSSRTEDFHPGKADILRSVIEATNLHGGVIGIGSPRASLESNFALRTLVGPERFYQGISAREGALVSAIVRILRESPVPAASIQDVEQADAVLILGQDVLNGAPRLALALLQSIRQEPMQGIEKLGITRWHDAAVREVIQDRKGPLFIIGHHRTWLYDVATRTVEATPEATARLGFAVAQAIDPDAPASALKPGEREPADRIAQALMRASRPLVLSGTGACSESVIQAAANVAWALQRRGRNPKLCYVLPDCNSFGSALMGGRTLDDARRDIEVGAAETVVILENDLYRRMEASAADRLLSRARKVLVLDHLRHRTAAQADVLLPAGTFAESDGTYVNNEGRAQRFYQVFIPKGEIQESWRWFAEVGKTGWRRMDDLIADLAAALPIFRPIVDLVPPSDFRMVGRKIPRQPERYSGRTAMFANLTIHEPPPPDDPDSPLAFSMEGYRGPMPSALIPQFWAPGWNSNQALNKFQEEVGGALREEMPGCRLVEPSANSAEYFTPPPPVPEQRPGERLFLPIEHIFGSEELSAQSPPIQERTPPCTVSIHPNDLASLAVQPGETVVVELDGRRFQLPVEADRGMPAGCAGLPLRDPLMGLTLPAWGRVLKA
jgi:NADH-quinone oxidoreductase subunit G